MLMLECLIIYKDIIEHSHNLNRVSYTFLYLSIFVIIIHVKQLDCQRGSKLNKGRFVIPGS